MIDRAHVAFLVEAGLTMPGHDGLRWYHGDRLHYLRDADDAARVGRMLWDANRASVQARYPDTIATWPENAPGEVGESFEYDAHRVPTSRVLSIGNGFRPVHTFKPGEVLKAIDCLDYQACEYDGWRTSEARAFLDALAACAIRQVAGYDAAEWGAPKGWVEAFESMATPAR